jgi:ubiquinone/menaquinone biosynthesis C-methylase UbiE
MSTEAIAAFFDGIADRWDGWEDLAALASRLDGGLADLGLTPDEAVVDVGCGTGNLTCALLARLSPTGRVVAVDLSPRMLQVARGKISDPRVTWHAAHVQRLPVAAGSIDRVFCYGVWPHLEDHAAAAREIVRVLRPGGWVHVWHLISRARVNAIHAGAGEAVRSHELAPATETGALLAAAGLQVVTVVDADDRYLVTARKQG